MNKHCYRLVFNVYRNMPMAVGEAVAAIGVAGQGACATRARTAGRPGVVTLALRAGTFALWVVLGHGPHAVAQIVADPNAGAHRPSVLKTANGIPQVNIARPSPAGVSTNAYTRFDVPGGGAVLNNASSIVTTQQAGYINGNPNLLPGGSARLIVNEVTGTVPSQLRGYLEVAGPRTEVVVANPNGIVVDGGGFINASRATLSTGTPMLGPGGALQAFQVTGGQIRVDGAGLDASSVDKVDLIARAISANAALHADRLHVVAGANRVDAATLDASPLTGVAGGPATGIDVGQLGGMYANKIVLVSTELGVGVSNQGVLAAQAGDLTLTGQGRLVLAGQTNAAGAMALQARDGIDNSGVTYGGASVSATTAGMLRNSGMLAAQQDLGIRARDVASAGQLGAGVNRDGSVGRRAELALTASHDVSVTGRNVAGGNMVLQGQGLSLAGSRTTAGGDARFTASAGGVDFGGAATSAARDVEVIAAGGMRSDKGSVTAGEALALDIAGTLSNRNGTLSGGTSRLVADAIDNTAGHIEAGQLTIRVKEYLVNRDGTVNQFGQQDTTIAVAGTFDNRGGAIASNGNDVTIDAAVLGNGRGKIEHAGGGTLRLSSGGWLDNDTGTVRSNGTLNLQAGRLDNTRGMLYGQHGMTLASLGHFTNIGGNAQSAGDLAVKAGGELDNSGGTLSANGYDAVMWVSAGRLVNRAGKVVNAGNGDMSMAIAADFDNEGGIAGGNGDTRIVAEQVSNRSGGKLAAGGALILESDGAIDNRAGSLFGDAGLSVAAGAGFDNRNGSAQTLGDLAIAAKGEVTNAAGTLSANGEHGAISVSGEHVDNAGGRLVNAGDGPTRVTAAGSLANAGGTLGGNGDLTVVAQDLSNIERGKVAAGRALTLHVSHAVNNRGGTLYGGTGLSMAALHASLANHGGTVLGGQDVSLHVASMSNLDGVVRANRDVDVGGAMGGSGEMTAGRHLSLDIAGDYLNDAANKLHSDGNLDLTATGTVTNTATLSSSGNMTVRGINVLNAAGASLNAAATTVAADRSIVNAGRIEGATVRTFSASLDNTGAIIGNDVQVNAGGVSNAGPSAIIAAAGQLNVYASDTVANVDGAHIYSAGHLRIAKDEKRDAEGMLANQANMLVNRSATIDADGDIDIAARSVNNVRGSIVTEEGAPQTSTEMREAWFAGLGGDDRRFHQSRTVPHWNWSGGKAAISAEMMLALRKPITIEVSKDTVATVDRATNTLRFATAPVETYVGPYYSCQPDSTCEPLPTRPLTTRARQYYQMLEEMGDSYTITFWPDWDPALHIRPDDIRVRTDLGTDSHDYNEIARTTTTTVSTDRLIAASPPGLIRAAGAIRVNADGGTVLNQSSTVAAGGNLVRRAVGGKVTDVGTALRQTVTTTDTSTFYWHQKSGGDQDTKTVPYPSVPVAAETVWALPAIASAGQEVQTTAQDIAVTTVDRIGNTVETTPVAGGDMRNADMPASEAAGARVRDAATRSKHPQTLGGADSGIPDLVLPVQGLFRYQPAPTARYLVATDPRFTQYGAFISSDYMLDKLGLDPDRVQKRLGDGFYEERLLRDQITRLTGRALLAGYGDRSDTYRSLMDNGVTHAAAFALVPGVALSEQQMEQLTSDMVWLVAQDVTLSDGSVQSVLLPKLYLARAHTVGLHDTGALVTGRSVSLASSGDTHNSGRIVGDVATQVLGNDIVNHGAIGKEGATTIRAARDLLNLGGRISGTDVMAAAGRDVVNTSQTISTETTLQNGYRAGATEIGSRGIISATGTATVLAGRDLNISGATVESGKDAMLAAGRDLNIDTVTIGTHQQAVSRGGQSYADDDRTTHAGSMVRAGNNIVAVAGRDATVSGSALDAGDDVALIAAGSTRVAAAMDTHAHREGSLGGKGAEYTRSSYDETARGSAIAAGNDITLAAGQQALAEALLASKGIVPSAEPAPAADQGDLAVLGSTVSTGVQGNGGGTARLIAAGDITVGTVRESHDIEEWAESRRSGLLSKERITRDGATHEDVAVGSTLSANRVAGRAGRDLTIVGSNVVASGDVVLHADRHLTIDAAVSESSSRASQETHKSGMFAGGGPGVTIGSQRTDQHQSAHRTAHTGSMVGSLHGDVALSAGDRYIQNGSVVTALEGDVDIDARRVDIQAATDTTRWDQETHFRQSGLTMSLSNPLVSAMQTAAQMGQAQGQSGDARTKALAAGTTALAARKALDAVAAQPGAAGGLSIGVALGSARSNSSQSQSSALAVGSRIDAGRNLRIRATGAGVDSDINVVGSDIRARDNASLHAEHRINLLAAENRSEQHGSSSSSSSGAGVHFRVGADGTGFGVAANASRARGNAEGNDTSWTHSHLTAGNTLTLESGGDTTLRGAVASGKQVVADIGGNLNIESVQDTSAYRSRYQSAGGSIMVGNGLSGGFQAGKQKIDSAYASVAEQSGIKAGDNGFQVSVAGKTNLAGGVITSTDEAVQENRNRFHSAGPLTQNDVENHADYKSEGFSIAIGGGSGAAVGGGEGHTASTTRSGISGIAGNASVRTGDRESGIANGFDADKVRRELDGQMTVGLAFAREASQAVQGYVEKNRSALREQIENAGTDAQRRAAQSRLDELHMEERALNILIGAVTGTGAATVTKEALSVAADHMRTLMIADSAKFAGVVDGDNPPYTNLSGASAGVRGSGEKIGGTRWDLDKLCGADNRRCMTIADSQGKPVRDASGQTQLLLNEKGQVQWNAKAAGMSLDQFLDTREGKALSGPTGGIQGRPGTLFGMPYAPGSWQDKLIESFAGTHDMIGGKLAGLYDSVGNAQRGRPSSLATAQDIWSATGAIAVSSPFAMAELLPPQVWNAISTLLKAVK